MFSKKSSPPEVQREREKQSTSALKKVAGVAAGVVGVGVAANTAKTVSKAIEADEKKHKKSSSPFKKMTQSSDRKEGIERRSSDHEQDHHHHEERLHKHDNSSSESLERSSALDRAKGHTKVLGENDWSGKNDPILSFHLSPDDRLKTAEIEENAGAHQIHRTHRKTGSSTSSSSSSDDSTHELTPSQRLSKDHPTDREKLSDTSSSNSSGLEGLTGDHTRNRAKFHKTHGSHSTSSESSSNDDLRERNASIETRRPYKKYLEGSSNEHHHEPKSSHAIHRESSPSHHSSGRNSPKSSRLTSSSNDHLKHSSRIDESRGERTTDSESSSSEHNRDRNRAVEGHRAEITPLNRSSRHYSNESPDLVQSRVPRAVDSERSLNDSINNSDRALGTKTSKVSSERSSKEARHPTHSDSSSSDLTSDRNRLETSGPESSHRHTDGRNKSFDTKNSSDLYIFSGPIEPAHSTHETVAQPSHRRKPSHSDKDLHDSHHSDHSDQSSKEDISRDETYFHVPRRKMWQISPEGDGAIFRSPDTNEPENEATSRELQTSRSHSPSENESTESKPSRDEVSEDLRNLKISKDEAPEEHKQHGKSSNEISSKHSHPRLINATDKPVESQIPGWYSSTPEQTTDSTEQLARTTPLPSSILSHPSEKNTPPDSRIIRIGSLIALKHTSSGKIVGCSGSESISPSESLSMTAEHLNPKEEDWWEVLPSVYSPIPKNTPVEFGQVIRLRHTITQKFLHSSLAHTIGSSPNQEVLGYGAKDHSDTNDHWIVRPHHTALTSDSNSDCWTTEQPVLLEHQTSHQSLHCHPGKGKTSIFCSSLDNSQEWRAIMF